MNNETTKTFSNITAGDIITLGACDDMYLNELAARLGRRIGLEMKVVRGLQLTAEQTADLEALVEVTDRALTRINLNGEAA